MISEYDGQVFSKLPWSHCETRMLDKINFTGGNLPFLGNFIVVADWRDGAASHVSNGLMFGACKTSRYDPSLRWRNLVSSEHKVTRTQALLG